VTLAPAVTDEFRWTCYSAAPLVPLIALIGLTNAELCAFGRLVAGQSLEVLIRPASTLLLVTSLYLYQRALQPFEVMAASSTGTALSLMLGLFWLRREFPTEMRAVKPNYEIRPWLAATAGFLSLNILRAIDASYPTLIAGALTSGSQTGMFRVAASSVLIAAMPLQVLEVVLAPTVARLYAEGDRIKLQLVLAVASASMFATALMTAVLIWVAGERLVTLLFGIDYAAAATPLRILAAGQLVGSLFGIGWVLLAMCGGERFLAGSYLAGILIGATSAALLSSSFGGAGVAAGVVIGTLVNQVCAWVAVRRRTLLDPSVGGVLAAFARQRKAQGF
jgi:O-antigen/teichoic acid export membrane protein